MNEEKAQKIKEILLEILQKMGIVVEKIETENSLDGTLICNLTTPDSGILIGGRGAHLSALQYLIRVTVYKKLGEEVPFVIDVGRYKKEREEFLRELVRQAAARVRETKEILFLKPMQSYERRVIHSEISKLDDIMTISEGEEPERRVVIKPRV